jgi:hypothetical protein
MLRRLSLLLAFAASGLAWGEAAELPERVVRLSYVEGQVAFQSPEDATLSTLPDRPLMPGDRLTTDQGGRAELSLGTANIRLDEHTNLYIVDLAESAVRLQLDAGTASFVVHELFEGEAIEIDTPNIAVALREPGEYRLDVSQSGATALTVRSGSADIGTLTGQVRVASGQRVQFEGREALASLTPPLAGDSFDSWVESREEQVAGLVAESMVAGAEEYEALDGYGQWYNHSSYGSVWMPSYAYGGYDPFGHGYWQPVGYYSFVWVEPLPWGYHTSHGGRWVYLDDANRWCWVPGKRALTQQFAREVQPFGTSRNARSNQGDANDRLNDLGWRAGGDDDGATVASANRSVRRLDPEGRTSLWHSAASDFKKAHGGGFVPRTTPRQGSSQGSSSASSNGGASQPSRSSSSSSSSTSSYRSSSSSRSSSSFGSRLSMPSSKGSGRPQSP